MDILAKASGAVALLPTAKASRSAMLPAAHAHHSLQPPACPDGTPHEETFVPVGRGVRLQVVDWGGADKPRTMVLLTGLGENAHVYDQFALQFTDHFHVLGITRRGFRPSSQPVPGRDPGADYDVDTRARDVIAVLDSLSIRKAVLVGHSVAGSELTAVAVKYGDRVERLVYLDAFDLSKRFQLPDIPAAPYTEADYRSLQILLAAGQRLEDIPRPAKAVFIGVQFDKDGRIVDNTTPPGVSEAILRGVQSPASPPTDWSKVVTPRLGIFNQPSVQGRLPFYPYLSAEDRKIFDTNWPAIVAWYRDILGEFAAEHSGTPNPVVYALPDAPHYFFLNHQAFVVLVMREFLLGKVNHDSDSGIDP